MAALLGCAGTTLTAAEKEFFTAANPFGFILFARNIDTPEQVRALTAALRACVGRQDAPILIDQEGGRVRRLRPPHWREAGAMRPFGDLFARDPDAARRALALNIRLMAAELLDLGIDTDCAPVLDVPVNGAHDIIGDRAFSDAPRLVGELGRLVNDTFLSEGVFPVVKHIPGHGRALSDSHMALPIVHATRTELEACDFEPFRQVADAPFAMTAHIIYHAVDPEHPATVSDKVIEGVIRDAIGFEGLLMTDDLSMHALTGPFEARAADSLRAGCDLVLHCNGDMAEMTAVVAGCQPMSDKSLRRWERAKALRNPQPEPFDRVGAEAELARLMTG